MYVVVEFLDAEPAQRAALRAALVMFAHSMMGKTVGCHGFDVAQDDLDGSAFLLYQRYDSKAAYVAQLELTEYAEHRLLVDPWVRHRRSLTYELLSEAGVA